MDDSYVTVSGRPYNGLAIMRNKQIASVIQYIGCSLDNRVMDILTEGVDKVICSFNVHLPCFENSDSYVSDVLACLFFIEWSFGQQKEKYSSVELCVIGDFNIDY